MFQELRFINICTHYLKKCDIGGLKVQYKNMSFMNDVNSYKKMVSKEIIQTPCTIEESSTEFMVLPKYEHIEETLVTKYWLSLHI